MMMFARPKFPDAGNGFRQFLVQGFPALFDRGGREIAGVADLGIEQVPGRAHTLESGGVRPPGSGVIPFVPSRMNERSESKPEMPRRITSFKTTYSIEPAEPKNIGSRNRPGGT